ncbi:MAG: hypothetical protein P8Z30_00935 [Acidobacteriota bacterium]
MIQKVRTPHQAQKLIRTFSYNHEKQGETLRSFRSTLRHRAAHCLEAALVAAAILEQHGYPPLLLDLESKDKLDHVVFVFRQGGRWGAVGRSRDLNLQGRKPLYRTLRHLVMSYVDPYVDGKGRIIGYALADLRTLVSTDWRFSPRNVWSVEKALIRLPHRKLKSSNRRYEQVLRRYLAFKEKYPNRRVTFYSDRKQWM